MPPNEALLLITLLVMVLGLVGSILPGLPGVPLIFASALFYAYVTDFVVIGVPVIVLLGLFALLAFTADFLGTAYGARRFGASNWGTVGGLLGGLVGAIAGALFFGIGALFGLLAGTIAGVLVGEFLRERRGRSSPREAPPRVRSTRPDHDGWRRALRAASGAFVGFFIGTVVEGALGLLSMIVFVVALVY
jgi:uncharacterized protein